MNPQSIGFVVVQIRRDWDLRDGIGLEFIEDHLNAGFELRVMAGGFVGGQVFDCRVGSDAMLAGLALPCRLPLR